MAKGVVLNVDALLAVLIASTFMVAIGMVQQPQVTNTYVERTANDVLTTLDKINVLISLNTTNITMNLNDTLPQNTDGSITINCYRYNNSYSGSEQNLSMFISDSNYTISNVRGSTKSIPIVSSVRYFPVTNATTVSKYCMARLEVWLL